MEFIVGTNTYMTVEEANSIVNDIYFDDDEEYKIWTGLDDNSKQKIILKGTRIMEKIVWLGCKYPGFNNLAWPRLIQCQIIQCPFEVKAAILKQSLKDFKNSKKQEHTLQELGVKTYSIKNASISFTDKTSANKLSNGIYGDVYTEYLSRWTAG